jgi:hypothetical protein
MEYIPVRVSDIIRQVNRDIYLPAIQREFVWGTDRVERLFDSIMADFPIGSFLYWKLEQKHKDDWPVYEFVRDFDAESPDNQPANMAGITKDITLVLDGQQRITSLFVGLRGSYRYFRYRWRETHLYLNLLKPPVPNEDNPEELTYEFAFRENADPSDGKPQLWYSVGRILDFEDAEDAKRDMKSQLAGLPEEQQENANKLIGRLHNRIHTTLVGNYYEEKSQEYEKVLQVFVRANSAGQPLEYSDLLLATATAKWETLDARKEFHDFTKSINETGTGYNFGKDFVLKASLYLTDSLPIQYKVKNFTRPNLRKIEANWEKVKESLATTVRLISRFGFNTKNVVAPLVLLPIALFLLKRGNRTFDTSSSGADADAQVAIRRWFVFSTLKNAFGGSSDTILARLRDLLKDCGPDSPFPASNLYKALDIEPHLNTAEIDRILGSGYQGRYTNVVLSLLYPDRDWKDAVFHEDHIFPQSEFRVGRLRQRGYDEQKIQGYLTRFNTLCNLQLLTESENLSKNATPFDEWIQTRDAAFHARHLIPDLPTYDFDHFDDFAKARIKMIVDALKRLDQTPTDEHDAFSERGAVGELQTIRSPSANGVVEERSEVRCKAQLPDENLVTSENDVVVVPAQNAWPEYHQYHAYVCQPDRSFRQVKRLAFYSDGQIYPLVPLILESHDHVEFPGEHKGRLGELVGTLLKSANTRQEGTAYKVVFLSAPDSPDTLKLDEPIPNDCKSKAGKPTAFVQNQRYVSSERLKTAKTTSDLVGPPQAVKQDNDDTDESLCSSAESEAMKIVWVEWEPGYRPDGHLTGFYDRKRGHTEEERLMAFIEGFAWLKGKPKQVTIRCIKPDALTTQATLDSFKGPIEDYIRGKDLGLDYLEPSRRLKVLIDG